MIFLKSKQFQFSKNRPMCHLYLVSTLICTHLQKHIEHISPHALNHYTLTTNWNRGRFDIEEKLGGKASFDLHRIKCRHYERIRIKRRQQDHSYSFGGHSSIYFLYLYVMLMRMLIHVRVVYYYNPKMLKSDWKAMQCNSIHRLSTGQ